MLTSLLLLPLALASPTPSLTTTTQIPLILWHGLGDNYAADGIASVAKLAEQSNPGTFVYPIRLADDASGDRSASFFGNLTEQLDSVCEDLAAHPILSQAPAVNALGFSQGGQFLRAYISRCNAPPVRNLVTFGSQHSGISSFQSCSVGDWLCHTFSSLLHSNAYGEFAQGRLVPAQYYRTLNRTTRRATREYLDASNFLADVNGEREGERNTTYARNMAGLEKFVMYVFEDDKTVVPKESGWFADVYEPEEEGDGKTEREVVPLRNTTLYKEDWIGLKELDEKKGLVFRTHPGEHMQLDDDVLESVFKEFFGPSKSKGESLVEQHGQSGKWEF
ncbi:alpha/beta-hydrolase [Aulographum hederae CBS 113979]|uniref:Palmitoyl-protein thioesterase 1 n=1 Tax=Aulographum hederae CBS 113979 TaxID=1176131 RepID=A0A6G1HH88_9PEZI|nr:alpha/beta-hydrolase [Aulographum hederae CBS 113979]